MPPFTNTPLRAAAVNAATILTGVEITNAQGQAMTSNTNARYTHSHHTPAKNSGGTRATATARAMTAGV